MTPRARPGGRSPALTRVAAKMSVVLRLRRGQSGQTMPLVLGICLVLTLGSMVLVQNTFQQYPIVTKDVVQHEAYRAMLAGVDEYLYSVNTNANFASCYAKYYNSGGTLVGSAPNSFSSSSLCSGIAFNTWVSVPGTASVNGPPMWFYLGTPNVNTKTGNLTMSVIGSAGYPNTYNYQTAQLVLQPLNSFLLNVLWMDKNQLDPAVLGFPSGDTCPYYWTSGSLASYSNGTYQCTNVDFATADSLTGNLYTNDTIFVCGSPTFLNAQTADPNEDWLNYGSSCSGTTPVGDAVLSSGLTKNTAYTTLSVQALPAAMATGDTLVIGYGSTTQTVTVASPGAAKSATSVPVTSFTANATYASGTQLNDNATGTWVSGAPIQPIPTDDSVLDAGATSGGCLYEGPTTITLNGTTMNVTSPNTPTGKPSGAPNTSVSNDSLNAAANTTNVCMPSSPGGSVAVPTNGIVYVEDCVNSAVCTTASPMAGTSTIDTGEEGVSTQNQNSVGDAIVQGSITNPLTIGTSNNIIIDGNLCYTDDVSGGTCTTAPTPPSTNVLGLVADNYVELSHPVNYTISHGNESITGNASTCPSGLGNGTTLCDQSNPIIDAVILALNGSFLVNYWNQGATLGTLTLNGTIDQAWRGPVATASGTTLVTGYAKSYVYDPRLAYLSPPYYLNPGTSQWGYASFNNVSGGCKMPTGQTCPTGYP